MMCNIYYLLIYRDMNMNPIFSYIYKKIHSVYYTGCQFSRTKIMFKCIFNGLDLIKIQIIA